MGYKCISMARRARELTSDQIEGSFKKQFRRIYDYTHELLRSNMRSTIKVKVKNGDCETKFMRLFTCFKACEDSFVLCRPI